MAALIATWTGSYARNPLAYTSGPPAVTPLAVPVTVIAGNWLFALVSWRQDAGTAGYLQYPSTVSVSDDAGNFWIPVESGIPATAASASPSTGVVRSAIWMAPAARACQFVFVSPTGLQSAVTVLVAEFSGSSPWYQIQAQSAAFTNQGGSVTLSQTIPSNVFALGVLAWDNLSGSVTATATGWTGLPSVTTSNSSNHSGDLEQFAWYITGSGASQTISATGTPTMDWADVIISVHGVTDAAAAPFSLQNQAGNWPVLITETGAGPALNADPVFAQGTAHWSGQNAAVAAATWPMWEPAPAYQAVQYGSLQVTPPGNTTQSTALSELEPVTTTTLYSALAFVYSPAGYGSTAAGTGIYVGINWYSTSSPASYISTSSITAVPAAPGEWTQLSLPPVFPPGSATFAAVVTTEYAGGTNNLAASAVFYAGYAAFGPADSYEGTAPDQITWTDTSTRNFTAGDLEITRGIQYENQTLEAGTMTVFLNNQDAALTFGNVQSPFWPNVGDTDVPIRLRAVWPGSITPYYPLFSGYTDDVKYGWDEQQGTWIAFASVTASDAWSRLTQQMLAAAEQETLADNPLLYAPCSATGANIAPGAFSSFPVVPLPGPLGPGAPAVTQSFTGTAVSLAGAPGLSCWQSAGTRAAGTSGNFGQALTWFPSSPVPVTASSSFESEFWFNPVSLSASQPVCGLVLCTCWGAGLPLWTLWIDNTSTASVTYVWLTTYSAANPTSTRVGTTIAFLNGAAPATYLCAVTFTGTTLTVTFNPGGTLTETLTVTGLFFTGNAVTGFSWGGNAGPFAFQLNVAPIGGPNTTTYGFMDLAVQGAAFYSAPVPPARQASHYQAGQTAFAGESDVWRLARIAGYSGFLPQLGMRGLDLPAAPAADVDIVTGATDTNTQVASAYFTNIASSTLAAMLVNGAGTLIYRRRAEWGNRPIGQWVLGELDPQALALPLNSLSAAGSVTGWQAQNGATLISSSQPAAGALFVPHCAVFTGNGSTPSPQIAFGRTGPGAGPAVTAGNWYTLSAWVYSPQGSSSGMSVQLQWYAAATPLAGTVTYTLPALPAGSNAFITITGRAPATADNAAGVIAAAGTPPNTTGFYIASVLLSQVNPDYAGGAGTVVPETPYLPDVTISSDRAQLFNYAVLTQYGSNLVSSFSGTNVLFTPSSGVIVLIGNQPSIALRGQVPYTATVYIDNTVQALPYYPAEGSIEDVGNWITQTLGSPLFRPDKVHITPAATPSALITGLQAEVGDTSTFRRRQPGVPEIQIPSYESKLTHTISIDKGQWDTEYELSPFPVGSILTADDVVHGVLDSQNLLGF